MSAVGCSNAIASTVYTMKRKNRGTTGLHCSVNYNSGTLWYWYFVKCLIEKRWKKSVAITHTLSQTAYTVVSGSLNTLQFQYPSGFQTWYEKNIWNTLAFIEKAISTNWSLNYRLPNAIQTTNYDVYRRRYTDSSSNPRRKFINWTNT